MLKSGGQTNQNANVIDLCKNIAALDKIKWIEDKNRYI